MIGGVDLRSFEADPGLMKQLHEARNPVKAAAS